MFMKHPLNETGLGLVSFFVSAMRALKYVTSLRAWKTSWDYPWHGPHGLTYIAALHTRKVF